MNEAENLDRLMGSLLELGFHRPNLYSYLESFEGADVIPYRQQERIGDDLMNYQLTIKRREETGLLYPESYQATLLKTHPMAHGKFGEIDTSKLEKRLKETDWNNYAQQVVASDKHVCKIFDDVFELSLNGDKQAKDIARRLKLRYWLNSPVEKHLQVANYAPDYEKTLQFDLNGDFSDISAREAYNLLLGRGVLKFHQTETETGNLYTHWKVIDDGRLKTLPDYDFMKTLKSLPIVEMQQNRTGSQLIYDLIRGERPAVTLLKDNRQIPGFIEANPRDQTLSLYSQSLEKLALNDFLPKESHQVKIQNQRPPKLTKPRRKPGKNKGRSI
jgi:hypothetical protein